MKILNLENEGNQEMLQEIKNRVSASYVFKRKFRALKSSSDPFLHHRNTFYNHTGTIFSEDTKHLCKIRL